MPSRVSQSLDGGPFQFAFRPEVDRLGRQDRRRPLDGVDLRDQRGHDQPRGLVDPFVAPPAVVGAQLVAEDVVLAGEQRVQPGEAQPPALVEAGDLHARGVLGQVAVVGEPDLRTLAQRAGLRLVGAVDLATRPTSARRRRRRAAGCRPGRPRSALLPAIRIRFSGCPSGVLRHVCPPGIGTIDVVDTERVPGVVDPVVDLELDPGGRQQVQRRGREEVLAGEQPFADERPGSGGRRSRAVVRLRGCGRTRRRRRPSPGRRGRCRGRRRCGPSGPPPAAAAGTGRGRGGASRTARCRSGSACAARAGTPRG